MRFLSSWGMEETGAESSDFAEVDGGS